MQNNNDQKLLERILTSAASADAGQGLDMSGLSHSARMNVLFGPKPSAINNHVIRRFLSLIFGWRYAAILSDDFEVARVRSIDGSDFVRINGAWVRLDSLRHYLLKDSRR